MSIVSYGGNSIIPAPLVQITKQYQKAADGSIIGAIFSLTLQGTLISNMGSPNSSGIFWNIGGYPPNENISDGHALESILQKQLALRTIFANEGQQLIFQPVDGSPPLKCNPRVNHIDFPAGTWYNRSEYTINLESDVILITSLNPNVPDMPFGEDDFTFLVDEVNESWSLETDEAQPENELIPRTYKLNHTVGAKGKRFYDDTGTLVMPAWQQAQNYVLPRLGFAAVLASESGVATIISSSGVNNLPAYYNGWNYVRNQQVDQGAGRFEVIETWILASGNTLETYGVESIVSNLDGTVSVNVNGTIVGLEVRDNNMNLITSKYQAASGRFEMVDGGLAFQRALNNSYQNYLNPIASNRTVTSNINLGNITYSYNFNNRQQNMVTGTKSEVITFGRTFGIDVFGEVMVLGRLAGPVLQPINTKQAATASLNMELVFGPNFAASSVNQTNGTQTNTTNLFAANPGYTQPYKGQIQGIVNAANPVIAGMTNNIGNSATNAYVRNQNENWNPKEGRYSLQIDWVFE